MCREIVKLLFLMVILSACHVVADKPALFKNKVFYGDWQPSSRITAGLGIMTITPTKVLYSKSKDTPVYDCPHIIDQTDEAVMIECYAPQGRKVYKVFQVDKSPGSSEERFYIGRRFCPATDIDVTPSLGNYDRFCTSHSYYYKNKKSDE